MKKKLTTAPEMAGEQDSNFSMRLPRSLHQRFKEAHSVGKKAIQADSVRSYMEPYCDFTDAHRRQPVDFPELCAWVLARRPKNKK